MLQWRARHLIAVIAITITGISAPALAQTYPERPVKLVTQGAAGSGPDVIARIVTDHLGRLWGQQQMPVESALSPGSHVGESHQRPFVGLLSALQG
jgi:tripartite-type tricarboxylate transporter receptor subunit TctC